MDFLALSGRDELNFPCDVSIPSKRPLAARPLWLAVVFGSLLTSLAGCHNEPDVVKYTVPKRPAEPPGLSAPQSDAPGAVAGGPFAGGPFAGGPFSGGAPGGEAKTLADDDPRPDRMLGAILIARDQGWFFKMQGSQDAVAARAGDFQAVVKSVHFTGEKPQWDVPDGWRQEPGDNIRYAFLRTASDSKDGAGSRDAKPMEISITMLGFGGKREDYLLSNVNRWRGQLHLRPITLGQLAESVSSLSTRAGDAVMVDLDGQLSAAGMGGGPMSRGPMSGGALSGGPDSGGPDSGGTRGPFERPSPPNDSIHNGAAGGVENAPASPHAEAPPREQAGRMLGAIVMRPGAAWFFKLIGPQEAVSRHVAQFDSLIASLKFADDAPPEWKLPDGWRQEPARGMRFATLKIDPQTGDAAHVPPEGDAGHFKGDIGPADAPVEVSVVKLAVGEGDELEYVLKNVNVWRDQLQAPRLSKEELAGATKRVALDGAEAIVVDIAGVLAAGGMNSPSGIGGPSNVGAPKSAPGGKDGN